MNKLCVCGKSLRGHVHFCPHLSIWKKAKRHFQRKQQTTRWAMEQALKEANRKQEKINMPVVDAIESIGNFFKMRHIPIGRIALFLLIALVIAIAIICWPIGGVR